MGIKITTDDYGIKVWRSDRGRYPSYSIIKGKKPDTHKNEYQEVQFKRGIELENGEEICIDNAFPTFRTWTDKNTGEERCKEVWMITEFRYKRSEPQQQVSRGSLVDMDTDDLPGTFQAAEDEIPF